MYLDLFSRVIGFIFIGNKTNQTKYVVICGIRLIGMFINPNVELPGVNEYTIHQYIIVNYNYKL